jgi:hypothetical protein
MRWRKRVGSTPPRIHNLEELLNLCALYDATFITRLPLVQVLNPYAVLIRYPGMTATVAEAKEAVHAIAGCAPFCGANWAYFNLGSVGLL